MLLSGVLAVVLFFVIGILYQSIKSLNDPDVKDASKLRMSIREFTLYKELWEDYQRHLESLGSDKFDAGEAYFVKNIFPRIKNMNNWRRFGEYQCQLTREEMLKTIK